MTTLGPGNKAWVLVDPVLEAFIRCAKVDPGVYTYFDPRFVLSEPCFPEVR